MALAAVCSAQPTLKEEISGDCLPTSMTGVFRDLAKRSTDRFTESASDIFRKLKPQPQSRRFEYSALFS